MGTNQATQSCPVSALKRHHGGTRRVFPPGLRLEFSSAVKSLPPLSSSLNFLFLTPRGNGLHSDNKLCICPPADTRICWRLNYLSEQMQGFRALVLPPSISNNFTGTLKFSRMLIQFIQALAFSKL